jgi:hypothetical protein
VPLVDSPDSLRVKQVLAAQRGPWPSRPSSILTALAVVVLAITDLRCAWVARCVGVIAVGVIVEASAGQDAGELGWAGPEAVAVAIGPPRHPGLDAHVGVCVVGQSVTVVVYTPIAHLGLAWVDLRVAVIAVLFGGVAVPIGVDWSSGLLWAAVLASAEQSEECKV